MVRNKTIEIRRYTYTYIIRCKYGANSESEIGYICTDSEVPLSEWSIADRFDMRDDGDEWEKLRVITNDFSYDDFLSNDLVGIFDGSYQCLTNDDVNDCLGYVEYIANYEIGFGDEHDEYKKNVLKSVLEHLDLRKQNPTMDYAVNRLLWNIFGIERDKKLNPRKQIELILHPKANDEILSKLVKTDYIKAMRRHLDRLGAEYHLEEETSKYRIGVVFLRFFYECSVWLPSFYNDDKTIRNYSEYMRLMSQYFGFVDEMKYREEKLKQYKPIGAVRTLYSTIKTEHYGVWMNLP